MNAQDEIHHIQQAQRSASAFTPLYEHYVSLVWNYCLARLREPERAADATSTTFLKAIKALPRYKPELRGEQTTFRSWLMTIARNVVLDEHRRRPVAPLDGSEFQLVSSQPGPEAIALANDRMRQLRIAYAQLSDQQQDVIRLRQQGLSGEEIGAVLGIRAGAVKSTYYRAIQNLRQLLEKGEFL